LKERIIKVYDMGTIEAELRDIKITLKEMSGKLQEFLSREPDLYTPRDVKVRY
jgi:hypothetical protein